ncbi:MAG: class I tRNA ligase family protein [Candidatus Hodarchaeales archaeon]
MTSEWFISTDGVRQDLLEAARTVKWIPASAGKRMEEWLLNMGDWCISRKRFWGLPLPFYECSCGEMIVIHSKKHLLELAVDKQKVVELKELHRPWIDDVKITCPSCGKPVARIPEVGDCWLDAGIVPFSTLNYLTDREYWEEWFPADLIIEMVEQVRLWFYSLLFMSVTLTGKAPYRTVMTHGKIRDERGEIFHKTSPNFIPFDRAVKEMGADPIRWLMFSKDLTKDLNFVNSEVHSVRRKLGPFWNALLFFLSNAEVDNLETAQLKAEINDPLDEWILTRLDQLSNVLGEKFDSCNTKHFTRYTEDFLDDLTNWWLKLSRHRFWKHDLDEHKLSAYTVLYRCLKGITMLTAPVMPFFSEAVYQLLVQKYDRKAPVSVFLNHYPLKKKYDSRVTDLFADVKTAVNLGLKARAMARIRLRQPLQSVRIATVNQPVDNLRKFNEPLKKALNVKSIDYVKDPKTMTKYRLKPNYKKLGPKYGKLIAQIAEKLESLSDEEVSSFLTGNTVTVQVVNESNRKVMRVELSFGDVEVVACQEKGYQSLSSEGVTVSLDTGITEDLRKEGFARDFVRHVQNARKQSGLDISDWIVLTVKGTGPMIEILGHFKNYIQKETLAREMMMNSLDSGKSDGDPHSWGLKLGGQPVEFKIST